MFNFLDVPGMETISLSAKRDSERLAADVSTISEDGKVRQHVVISSSGNVLRTGAPFTIL